MARAIVSPWPGFQLTVDSDGEMVESNLLVADKGWTFVDSAGHGHLWRDGYPTLKEHWTGCDMGHNDGCRGTRWYSCRTCGERVVPGLVSEPPRWVPGPVRYTLTLTEGSSTHTWRFGPDRWDTLDDMVRAAIRDALGDPDEIEFRP